MNELSEKGMLEQAPGYIYGILLLTQSTKHTDRLF